MATNLEPLCVELSDSRCIDIHEAARQHPAEFALGAHHDGELVGMVVCDPSDGPTGHLTVVVKPEWRGLGVGRALLRGMAERARDRGFAYLTLSYSIDNHAASAMVVSSDLVAARRLRNGLVKASLVVPASSNVASTTLAA